MASDLQAFFFALLDAVTTFLRSEPMIYLIGVLVGVSVLRMFMLFIRPGKE